MIPEPQHGIEPTTFLMPWNYKRRILLTANTLISDESPRTGCVVTQLGLGCQANRVRGVANAPGLHVGKYRAEPA